MRHDDNVVAVIVLAVFLVAVTWGVTFGLCRDSWRRAAVKHGAAEYDSTTGNWKWKETSDGQD